MSAETLRKAAALMRERAEAATPGVWDFMQDAIVCITGSNAEPYKHIAEFDCSTQGHADQQHTAQIADPAVALAVADLLDLWADRRLLDSSGSLDSEKTAVLTIARAYLGEPA